MSRISESIRAFVRKRAEYRCEYCRQPDILSSFGFHVDHIIPLAHGGTSDVDNLAWACFDCNVAKGRDVASYDDITGALTPLFHPRSDDWDQHFMFDGPVIKSQTKIGRVTLHLLLINDVDRIETRMLFMEDGLWD